MELTINTELVLTKEKEKELASIIGCETEQLKERLIPYSQAALNEMLAMILGDKVFSRISDLYDYRLLMMMKYVLAMDMPTESFVSKHFQSTPSASHTMIKSVLSKYQIQLKSPVDECIKRILGEAKLVADNEEESYEIMLPNHALLNEINKILVEKKVNYITVRKKNLSPSVYTMPPATYAYLCNHYGIKLAEAQKDEEK